jgi:hypothetical protein
MLSEEYQSWNTAIAEAVYNSDSAGSPVYLDLDDSKFELITQHLALIEFDATRAGLASAVRNAMDFSAPKSRLLWPIVRESRAWMSKLLKRENPDGSPPMIAFLAVAVLAAEEMGNGEANANAYYAQLFKLLKVQNLDDQKKLEGAYRENVLVLWGYLKKWLTELEWEFGMPTAEALSHPYVSVAMSQALVREGDRRKLGRMFDLMNFTPGEFISPAEMTDYFNIWIQREDSHVSNSLKALWAKSSARQRISEVLSKELEVWDGSVLGGAGNQGQGVLFGNRQSKLKLTLVVSSYLGVPRLLHSLALSSQSPILDDQVTLHATSGPEVPLLFQQTSKTHSILQNVASVPLDSLLTGDLEVTSGAGQKPSRRIPKDVVVLAFDEELQMYLETERASFGQDLWVLIRDVPALMANLHKILNSNARPGFQPLAEDTSGLPSGWVLIRNVQLVSAFDRTFELRQFEALSPLASSQLTLSGGLKIPGPMASRKFLSGHAPEILAISHFATRVEVRLFQSIWSEDTFEDKLLQTWKSDNGVLSFKLAEEISESGDYRVELLEDGSKTIQRDFFLRSGNSPDLLGLRNAQTLVHSFDVIGAAAAFEAHVWTEDSTNYICGGTASYIYEQTLDQDCLAEEFAEWIPEGAVFSGRESEKQVVIPKVNSDSCIYTGKHNRELPMCTNGAKYVLGVCINCGDTKAEYCSAYLATKRRNYDRLSRARTVTSVPPVIVTKPDTVDYAQVLDLMNHVVSGSARALVSSLETLATDQMSATQILELFEQLGHIEVTRTVSGKPDQWALVMKQVLFRNEQTRSALLGLWQSDDREALEDLLANLDQAEPPQIGLAFDTPSSVEGLSEQLAELDFDYGSPNEVLGALPGLGWVRENLKRLPLPTTSDIDVFDLQEGRWIESEHLVSGAVRLRGSFGARYYYLSQEDLRDGEGVSSTATIVKYLAANEQNMSLLKYSTDESSIYVPLGAKIPGLYGRAVLLASGTPPVDIEINHQGRKLTVTQYKNVPIGIAKMVSNLLMN